MERSPEYLLKRADPTNTETPRECHLQAMLCAYKGVAIPYDVYNAVLASAERRREVLEQAMDSINKLADMGKGPELARLGMISLAGSIVNAEGIDGPKAAKRRLDNLGKYFQGLLFTELSGPTE